MTYLLVSNFRSVLPNQDKLFDIIETCNRRIVLGTETWLSDNVLNNELVLNNDLAILWNDRV